MSKTPPQAGGAGSGEARPGGLLEVFLLEVFPGSDGERRDSVSGCNLSLGWLLAQDSQENKIVSISLSVSP